MPKATKDQQHFISRIPIWTFFTVCWWNLCVVILVPTDVYDYTYIYSYETLNSSLAISFIYLRMCWKFKLCIYNWAASALLGSYNIMNVLFVNSGQDNYAVYQQATLIGIMAGFSGVGILLFYFNKK